MKRQWELRQQPDTRRKPDESGSCNLSLRYNNDLRQADGNVCDRRTVVMRLPASSVLMTALVQHQEQTQQISDRTDTGRHDQPHRLRSLPAQLGRGFCVTRRFQRRGAAAQFSQLMPSLSNSLQWSGSRHHRECRY